MAVTILRANATDLPLADESVDLVVTSPPYFALRSYQDGGTHYAGQLGSEPTPAKFVDALIAVTRECVRVLKPSGSLWVNLGDKYAGSGGDVEKREGIISKAFTGAKRGTYGVATKSLMGIPWRYAIRCIDDLGLILRAEVIWSKPNGLPESVTDRVRRSHETWFHLVREPRYYSAVDEIREEQKFAGDTGRSYVHGRTGRQDLGDVGDRGFFGTGQKTRELNPLGKLPGSVWTIPTQPLTVPAHLGIDHFAAFPMEWPRRIIQGWSPRGVCTACGEGRRPVVDKDTVPTQGPPVINRYEGKESEYQHNWKGVKPLTGRTEATITGYVCACPDTTAPTRPSIVLDPFGGTGTVALVAHALGRHGISIDLSADYCRLAAWRTSDPGERARAMQVPKPPPVPDGQEALFTMEGT